MNILNKFINLENNDVCNKIYTYIGIHPLIEITGFKKIIYKWDEIVEYWPINHINFQNFYFNIVLVDTFLCFEEYNFDDDD